MSKNGLAWKQTATGWTQVPVKRAARKPACPHELTSRAGGVWTCIDCDQIVETAPANAAPSVNGILRQILAAVDHPETALLKQALAV